VRCSAIRNHPGLDVAAFRNHASTSPPTITGTIQQHRVSAGYFRVLGVAADRPQFSRQEDVPGR
jgi:hypothetical protein